MIAPARRHVEATYRLAGLDRLRGLAVVLMVLDHGLVVALDHGAPASLYLLRATVTRAALPLFMVTAGYLWAMRGVDVRRQLRRVGPAALACVPLALVSIHTAPEVLAVYCGALLAAPVALSWPVGLASVAVVQFTLWPLPWSGYQPGYVLLFVCLGVLARRAGQYARAGDCLPAWLAWPGRHPLSLYVGHLAALTLLEVVR